MSEGIVAGLISGIVVAFTTTALDKSKVAYQATCIAASDISAALDALDHSMCKNQLELEDISSFSARAKEIRGKNWVLFTLQEQACLMTADSLSEQILKDYLGRQHTISISEVMALLTPIRKNFSKLSESVEARCKAQVSPWPTNLFSMISSKLCLKEEKGFWKFLANTKKLVISLRMWAKTYFAGGEK